MKPGGILVKAGLAAFGVVLGLAVSVAALEVLKSRPRGTEFENLDELRASMNAPDGPDQPDSSNLKHLTVSHPDDEIIYELRPGLDLIFQRARVRTNSCGMRDVERKIARGPGVYRIALLGDSFAFGWGVEQEQTFAARLESNLNRLAAGKLRFEVLNFGVPGYSTFQEVKQFREKGLEFEPDEVVVYFIENDFGLPFFVKDLSQPGGMLAATEFARLAWRAIDPDIEEQRLRLEGYDANRALVSLGKLGREHGVRVSVVVNPGKGYEDVKRKLWALRRSKVLRTIDIAADIQRSVAARGIETKQLSLSFDPHPSALKHALIGDALTPYFMDRLP